MRAILGTPGAPGSAYMLVLRGLDSVEYLKYHAKEYPTWGCLVFPEDKMRGVDIEEFSLGETIKYSPIHQLFSDLKYAYISDEHLLKWVRKKFPPFDEDDDPATCCADTLKRELPFLVEAPLTGYPRVSSLDTLGAEQAVSRYEFEKLGRMALEKEAYTHALSAIFKQIRDNASKYVQYTTYERPDGSFIVRTVLAVGKWEFESLGASGFKPAPPADDFH